MVPAEQTLKGNPVQRAAIEILHAQNYRNKSGTGLQFVDKRLGKLKSELEHVTVLFV